MTLLETNDQTHIINHIKQKHVQHLWNVDAKASWRYEDCPDLALTQLQKEFAEENRKRIHGQWLVLRKPFRCLRDFEKNAQDIINKVPQRYRNFALCMRYARNFWDNDEAIKEEMKLEANSNSHIDTVLAKVAAQRRIVEKYLAGDIAPDQEVDSSLASSQDCDPREHAKPKLTRSQKSNWQEI